MMNVIINRAEIIDHLVLCTDTALRLAKNRRELTDNSSTCIELAKICVHLAVIVG
jgi:hypothetical protein